LSRKKVGDCIMKKKIGDWLDKKYKKTETRLLGKKIYIAFEKKIGDCVEKKIEQKISDWTEKMRMFVYERKLVI